MMKRIIPIVSTYFNTNNLFSLLLKLLIHELKHFLTVDIYLVYIHISEHYSIYIKERILLIPFKLLTV